MTCSDRRLSSRGPVPPARMRVKTTGRMRKKSHSVKPENRKRRSRKAMAKIFFMVMLLFHRHPAPVEEHQRYGKENRSHDQKPGDGGQDLVQTAAQRQDGEA